MVEGNSWADSLISSKCSSTIEDTTENQCAMLSPNVEDIPTPFDYKHVSTDLSLVFGELDTANPVTERCLVNSYTGPGISLKRERSFSEDDAVLGPMCDWRLPTGLGLVTEGDRWRAHAELNRMPSVGRGVCLQPHWQIQRDPLLMRGQLTSKGNDLTV